MHLRKIFVRVQAPLITAAVGLLMLATPFLSSSAISDDRVTHFEVIEKYPWVRNMGAVWLNSGGAQGHPPNQVPMYGGVRKNQAMIDSDQAFLAKARELAASDAEAVEMSIVLGFRYFAKRDMATAMKRFNQAWLIDPDRGDIYHGFALVLIERDRDYANAERFLKIATGIQNTGPRAFADYGRFLIVQRRYADAVPMLRTAREKGPELQQVYTWLALALMRTGETAEACSIMEERTRNTHAPEKREKLLRSMGCEIQ